VVFERRAGTRPAPTVTSRLDPNRGISPEEVLANRHAGKYRRVERAHFVHR